MGKRYPLKKFTDILSVIYFDNFTLSTSDCVKMMWHINNIQISIPKRKSFLKILQLVISSLFVESFALFVESLNVHFFSCFSKLWIWVENLLQNCYLHISHIMSWCIKVFASRFGQNSSADIASMFGNSVLKAPVRLSYVLLCKIYMLCILYLYCKLYLFCEFYLFCILYMLCNLYIIEFYAKL